MAKRRESILLKQKNHDRCIAFSLLAPVYSATSGMAHLPNHLKNLIIKRFLLKSQGKTENSASAFCLILLSYRTYRLKLTNIPIHRFIFQSKSKLVTRSPSWELMVRVDHYHGLHNQGTWLKNNVWAHHGEGLRNSVITSFNILSEVERKHRQWE